MAAGDLIGGSPVPLRAVPRRAVRRVAERDGPRRQQRRQPRVRRGHRPSCCACRTAAATRVDGCYFPRPAVPGRRLPVARRQRRAQGHRQAAPARHVRQEGQRRQGRLHRDDPGGHPDPGQPSRRRRASTSRTRWRPPTHRPQSCKEQGVKSIVVLLHEGGVPGQARINDCVGISDPIVDDREADDARGRRDHHRPHPQPLHLHHPRPGWQPRLVTSAASYGQVRHRDRPRASTPAAARSIREQTTATNHLVTRAVPRTPRMSDDHRQVEHPRRRRSAGQGRRHQHRRHPRRLRRQPRHRDAHGGPRRRRHPVGHHGGDKRWRPDRLHERRRRASGPAADAQVREGPGEITYAEAYDVAPFGNLLNTLDLTGAQIKEILEQQYQPIEARGSRRCWPWASRRASPTSGTRPTRRAHAWSTAR